VNLWFLADLSRAEVSIIPWCSIHLTSIKFSLLQTWHKCSLWGPEQVLLLFKSIQNPKWPPWHLIGWHIFNFFSRMTAGIYSKLCTNVPYGVLTKCCYLFKSGSEIQDGHPGLWLADLLTHFWFLLEVIYSQLSSNVPYMVPTKCMLLLFKWNQHPIWLNWPLPDLLTHFQFLLKNDCRNLLQTWHKCSLWYPDQVLLHLCWSEIQYGHTGWHTRTWSSLGHFSVLSFFLGFTKLITGPLGILFILYM